MSREAPMRIAMISDNEYFGGAAISASRLALGLVHHGHEVLRIVDRPSENRHEWSTRVVSFKPRKPLWWRLTPRFMRKNRQVPVSRDIFARASHDILSIVHEFTPDVINFHNIHSARTWPLDLVKECYQIAPVIWTLHDMWTTTGRCAYSYDCRRFETGCNAECPTAMEYPILAPKLIQGAWEQRKRIYDACPEIAVVTPSQWLAREARSGLWKDHRVEVIPYGLPLQIYTPMDRQAARQALNVSAKGPVLLAVAQSWEERRKGGHLLVAALRKITDRPVTLMMLGEGQPPELPGNIQIIPLGHVSDQHKLMQAYNAADMLLHPAQVDNLPNVVLEALACGTPTVGFPIGGMPDMVRPGQTGWLARALGADELYDSILQAFADLANGKTYRTECRRIAEQEYNEDLQATRYEALIASLKRTPAAV